LLPLRGNQIVFHTVMIIRELFEEDAPLLLALFLDLPATDRSRRFGRPMTDEAIHAYVARLAWADSVFLGAFDPDAKFVGLLELADVRNGAEIAVVVDPSARGKGLGKTLMDRALLKAKVRGAQRVVLLCQMDNEPMRRLAHSAGLHAHLEDGEVEGSFAQAQVMDRTQHAGLETIGNVSYAGLVATRAWSDLIETAFNVRRHRHRDGPHAPESAPEGAAPSRTAAAAPARLPGTRRESRRPRVR
jgi:GNAT superfamily N-acetyltransferase